MHARFALTFERGELRHRLVQRAKAIRLKVTERPNLLLVTDQRTQVLAGSRAVALGQLFGADGQRLSDLGCLEPSNGPSSGPWGNFAMFGEKPASVYRDPSGSVGVHQLDCELGTVFVSDAAMAAELALLDDSSIDPQFLVHWLQFPYLRTSRTGIAAAAEILPGTLRKQEGEGWADVQLWKPADHCASLPDAPPPERLAAALRGLAVRTVGCQLGGSRPLLQLSGGLDSSIVAACLGEAAIPFSAVNFATRSADGDERRYARAVADRFGARLSEIHEDGLSWSLEPPPEPRFRPASNPVLEPLDRAVERCRTEHGSDLLVDGGGGDNLFGFLTSAAPVVDALVEAGPAAAWRTMGDVATRAGCSSWEVAGNAALRAVDLARPAWREDRRLLNRNALLNRADRHPWLEAPFLARPAKREHVAALVEIQHFLDRRARPGQVLLRPLMAQPLLEFCLHIPAWQWVRGGVDRAVAREAFAGLLPRDIVTRRSKGSLQGLFERAFARLAGELRDLLQGGQLRRLGIIDSAAIDLAFGLEDCGETGIRTRLSEIAALELWLQSWSGMRRPGAP